MNPSLISRRRVLHGGAALLAAPLIASLARPGAAWAESRRATSRSLLWIVQPELPASIAYAHRAQLERVMAVTGRIDHLLYRQLVPQLQTHAFGLTGVTDAATLFCIETVVADHGLRTVRRTPLDHAGATSSVGQDQLVSWLMLPRRQAQRPFNEVPA